jgi:hypothetical protein
LSSPGGANSFTLRRTKLVEKHDIAARDQRFVGCVLPKDIDEKQNRADRALFRP